VAQVKELGMSEYMGWQRHFSDKNAAVSAEPTKRNLLDGSTEDLIKGLTG
jgi:hypothetical protein